MRKVEVVPYRPEWNVAFQEEAGCIRAVMGNEIEEIHHIGSTSVPGLAAKPIIDIMVLVRDIRHVDDYNPAMASLGYEACGENGITGRRFFRKGGDARTHHVHVFETTHPDVFRHLAFRDYLRTFPAVRATYGALKQRLALAHARDVDAYIAGKSDWIRETEAIACAYYERLRTHEGERENEQGS